MKYDSFRQRPELPAIQQRASAAPTHSGLSVSSLLHLILYKYC